MTGRAFSFKAQTNRQTDRTYHPTHISTTINLDIKNEPIQRILFITTTPSFSQVFAELVQVSHSTENKWCWDDVANTMRAKFIHDKCNSALVHSVWTAEYVPAALVLPPGKSVWVYPCTDWLPEYSLSQVWQTQQMDRTPDWCSMLTIRCSKHNNKKPSCC